MAFGKAFGAALGLYAALNFGLSLVVVAVSNPNGLVASLTINNILLDIFLPAVIPASQGFIDIALVTVAPSTELIILLFSTISLLLPPILASLIAGKLAEEPKSAFGAWFLVPVLFAVVVLILFQLVTPLQTIISDTFMLLGVSAGQGLAFLALFCVLMGVVNGLAWSGLACVVTGP